MYNFFTKKMNLLTSTFWGLCTSSKFSSAPLILPSLPFPIFLMHPLQALAGNWRSCQCSVQQPLQVPWTCAYFWFVPYICQHVSPWIPDTCPHPSNYWTTTSQWNRFGRWMQRLTRVSDQTQRTRAIMKILTMRICFLIPLRPLHN